MAHTPFYRDKSFIASTWIVLGISYFIISIVSLYNGFSINSSNLLMALYFFAILYYIPETSKTNTAALMVTTAAFIPLAILFNIFGYIEFHFLTKVFMEYSLSMIYFVFGYTSYRRFKKGDSSGAS